VQQFDQQRLRGLLRLVDISRSNRVLRICANKVVSGGRFSTRPSTIRAQDTRQSVSAQHINQFEGLAAARPTVHQEGPYRFFFYSADRNDPPHVHVERDASRAKFWIAPVRLARSGGFGAAELLRVERLVVERESWLLRVWDEYFTDSE